MPRSAQQPWLRQAVAYAAWAALAAPASVILHEFGHLAVAGVLGIPARLQPGSVSGGARLGEADPLLVGFQAGAGPLVTVVVTLLACWGIARRGPHPALVALALFAPARFLVAAINGVVRMFLAFRGGVAGTPNFDEYNLSAAWGLPLNLVAAIVTVFLAATWLWTARRIPAPRLLALVAVIVGGAAGLALWLNILGPLLLG